MEWIIDCVKNSLPNEFGKETRDFIERNKRYVDDFLNGSAPHILFIIHNINEIPQQTSVENSTKINISNNNNNNNNLFPLWTISSSIENIEFLRNAEGCYFLRTKDKVDERMIQEGSIFYGEIKGESLSCIESVISNLSHSLCDIYNSNSRNDAEFTHEFLVSLNELISELNQTIYGMSNVITLSLPSAETILQSSNVNSSQLIRKRTSSDVEIIKICEETIRSWCKIIDELVETEHPIPKDPQSEINYWRMRTSTLTNISQQLKQKEAILTISVLSQATRSTDDNIRRNSIAAIQRWKVTDVKLTEASNESKDNLKYLLTLEKHLAPLYNNNPSDIIETLPVLFNTLKLIYTIARHYNSPQKMGSLLAATTNQLIDNCQKYLLENQSVELLWEKDPKTQVNRLAECHRFKMVFMEEYEQMKSKLKQLPHSVSINFDEIYIFGKLQLFDRRIVKMMDLFTIIDQFMSLSTSGIENIDVVINDFKQILSTFRRQQKNLLDYTNSAFDREYVQFIAFISQLEERTQSFIDNSFDQITGIEQSLQLLEKYKLVFQREKLRQSLDSKFNQIFLSFEEELEEVKELYEKEKEDHTIERNMPPVSGSILWSRSLLHRIEKPMKMFEKSQSLLSSKDAKRIIKYYNKIVRTLCAFEYLWYQAWSQSIEKAKTGLHATLLILHPEDRKLYVNFDPELFQLIREAKCLERMGFEIPENAKVMLLQENKFKSLYDLLKHIIQEYDRIMNSVIPVTTVLLKIHFRDMEEQLRPGLITLTWTSMNIESYIDKISNKLSRLSTLVFNINDIIAHRIEQHLRIISKTHLLDLSSHESFTMNEFLALQEKHIQMPSKLFQMKNLEIERSVEDLLEMLYNYPLGNNANISNNNNNNTNSSSGNNNNNTTNNNNSNTSNINNNTSNSSGSNNNTSNNNDNNSNTSTTNNDTNNNINNILKEKDFDKIRKHYAHFFYQAVLHSVKQSLSLLKKRMWPLEQNVEIQPIPSSNISISSNEQRFNRLSGINNNLNESHNQKPFFEVDVLLSQNKINLSPDLNEIQQCINNAAKMIFTCLKQVYDWKQDNLLNESKSSLFDKVTSDLDVVRLILLLNGSVRKASSLSSKFLSKFEKYRWLWTNDKESSYLKFASKQPNLDDYKNEMNQFISVITEIQIIPHCYSVGCVSLKMDQLKNQITFLANDWRIKYAENIRSEISQEMGEIMEHIRSVEKKLNKKVTDLMSLKYMVDVLTELRENETKFYSKIDRIVDTFDILIRELPDGSLSEVEMDTKTLLHINFKKLIQKSQLKADELMLSQNSFKRKLIKDVKEFKDDIINFRSNFLLNGPMIQGIRPEEAIERLNRFKEELSFRVRKEELYINGENLFKLPITNYPDLSQTTKDVQLCDQLFGLYSDVKSSIESWKDMPFKELLLNVNTMTDKMDGFSSRSKKMPKRVRDWEAFIYTKNMIEDFLTILPLLQELSKESIQPRHWESVMHIAKIPVPDDIIGWLRDFKLKNLLEMHLHQHESDILEITDGADKELKIEISLNEINDIWNTKELIFQQWKGRNVNILKAFVPILDELDETQMNLQTMLTMRAVAPFREKAQNLLEILSDTSETLERWVKVQMLWCSLESVFTGGDIARQLPIEAKKFSKVDKDWSVIMDKALTTKIVIECCSNENLKILLPIMYFELEKCQKSLEGYLEQKRSKFPRFYFVSNAGLLLILSQGSDPLSMNQYYEKVFDSIDHVTHNPKDKFIIQSIVGYTEVPLLHIVRAQGNIEDWLNVLLQEMRITLKNICGTCAIDVLNGSARNDSDNLRRFVDNYIAQFALLGIQFLWTDMMTEALEQSIKNKKVLGDAAKNQAEILKWMSTWCLQDLGEKSNRRKIETLVTVHVHQRDVSYYLSDLSKKNKLKSGSNDFEWLKQARFYWKQTQSDDTSNDGACVISITDVDFNYQYEFLGSKERLVITPLTDRCYITLSQALGMSLGGAPAGPAGTGKTETVKDLGNTLGIYVVVTNCTDQMRYTDCAKIFKGLCQGGLWGCFDEFNRILLPVLSVVAQQVLAIQNAKKSGAQYLQFPGDVSQILLRPVCGFFITMNPGYAGRQELPENLKVLFRGVAMMVPNFDIIMKVKLCSVGYNKYELLAKKFFVLYDTCKQQLSKQKHYDWGLRNILAVLRTAGATKRSNVDKPEEILMYQTLRDMNLSKLVAQDVPLFLSLLADLFPSFSPPDKQSHKDIFDILPNEIEKLQLINHDGWVDKVIQLYETTLVRHGIMLVGPTGGGKSQIFKLLMNVLIKVSNKSYKTYRMNPKALRAQEMYGETDPISGEWVTGVFAAIWAKSNDKNLPYNTWIIMDGPVDAIWIEDLNTVLDDNKLLTLANGDRFPMSDNVKLMFEVETLINASPATVSRAGIIFVSETDLDWSPVAQACIKKRPDNHQLILKNLISKYFGTCTPNDPGSGFSFIIRNTKPVMSFSRVGVISNFFDLLIGLLDNNNPLIKLNNDVNIMEKELEKIFLYCYIWTVGSLLEVDDRMKVDEYLRSISSNLMPKIGNEETIYEYHLNDKCEWELWRPPRWKYPTLLEGQKLDFSNLLVPTMDSTRAIFLMQTLHKLHCPVLLVGGSGTAKTSTALMFFSGLDHHTHLIKRLNFSSATTSRMFQDSIEADLEKRGGKNYGPAPGKTLNIFIDDISMPLVNKWNDQPTLEIVRLLMEQSGFPFLDKDKRGDWKSCEQLQYIAAMSHPGQGANDVPSRLRRQFFSFNLVLPSVISINDIYGQMLQGAFPSNMFDSSTMQVIEKLTEATIKLWRRMKIKMLPTPSKFHYVFNMRELSRVFQGILLTPKETILSGGGIRVIQKLQINIPSHLMVIKLWLHECERVFCDKLTNQLDKSSYQSIIKSLLLETYGEDIQTECVNKPINMVYFLRDDIYDDEDILVEKAPKIYEIGGNLHDIRTRVLNFLEHYNEEYPQKKMQLVLFDDALNHLMRINRLIETARGNALLVGVGGSGKQSLARLASYIARSICFQIVLTKNYNINSFLEDIRQLYRLTGHQRKQTSFIFTDSEMKDENFLEYINSILLTGDIAGLFPKDEMMAMTADLRNDFLKERPNSEENLENLRQFFIDSVRNNLHIILCMSPLHPLFASRARKFPGLFSATTIDWFLPWPEEALISVSRGFIENYPIECTKEEKDNLIIHMGSIHRMVTDVCDEYFLKMRRQLYQTPKSYLSFIQTYQKLYTKKLEEIKEKETRVSLGLMKLIQGAKDVEAMKLVLAEEQTKLAKATEDMNVMIEKLQISSLEAKKEGEKVFRIKTKCQEDADRIAAEKLACEEDLAKAQPFVDMANTAIQSIRPPDINEVKNLKKPADIIKLIVDGLLILFQLPLVPVTPINIKFKNEEMPFIMTSFDPFGQRLIGNTQFLPNLRDFGSKGKDLMNEETVEFLMPYLDLENFDPVVANNASKAAKDLCIYVQAMKEYFYASRVVKPKLEALAIAESQMEAANKALKSAEEHFSDCQMRLKQLQNFFDAQMAEKKRIEDGANILAKKAHQASELIHGLSGEQLRWAEDAKHFAEIKHNYLGDCAIAAAFISYCGPFNQEFRNYLIQDKFKEDCVKNKLPVTNELDLISFLVDIATISDWNLQGLPNDPLSIQNGILITCSSRYPLLIDPQGQALQWLKQREIEKLPGWSVSNLNNNKLKDQLEYCMNEGKAMILVGVEEEIDPFFDPILEKQFIKKGHKTYVNVADKMIEINSNFILYFITRLPNPKFSPELQAKTSIVDFTVTQFGLEEQLLAKVIAKEQKALEDQLSDVLAEVNQHTKALFSLDASLLERLTSHTGNLLEDEELIHVLAITKKKAAEVNAKLQTADETKKSINEKREQFRSVATRGSILYFSIVEMSLVNNMYQTSLTQFTEWFIRSMELAEKAAIASKRVTHIIETLTYLTFRNFQRGLYEKDKLTFLMLVTLKILQTASLISSHEIVVFLRGGAAIDRTTAPKKPYKWLTNEEYWFHIVELTKSCKAFKDLFNEINQNEASWRSWYEESEPEQINIPSYEEKWSTLPDIAPFLRLLLIRCLRTDRTLLVAKDFIEKTEKIGTNNLPVMGKRFIEPITDTLETIVHESNSKLPILFLLSQGADPTESIEQLARKKKLPNVSVISMGEGQEVIAMQAMNQGVLNGTWTLIQNCELGLSFMNDMEEYLNKLYEKVDPNFRLFLTALPTKEFPLSLLQMSMKVTNEPPAGLKAGLLRSYTAVIDQERLERVDSSQYHLLLFALCFLHSIVQERRKFGSLGWCIPYEFNTGDLTACITFLEKHLYHGPVSWQTLQYMVSDVQYGGKITDDLDRRLFDLYTTQWISSNLFEENFNFSSSDLSSNDNSNRLFSYHPINSSEVSEYRAYCKTFPEIDSPEIFGLHPNADLTFRVKEANRLFTVLSETQPKRLSTSGGISREDMVLEKAKELFDRLPEEYIEDDTKAKIQKFGGFGIPLNIFLWQEIQRFQSVIYRVHITLKHLQMAIQGEIVMSEELQQTLDAMADAKAPDFWIFTPSGDEFSWMLYPLGLWFASLLQREKQYRSWLQNGRPSSFWLTGFFNPQGLLTAMKQEVTRKHKNEQWSLDDVVYHSEVKTWERIENVHSVPSEGIYIYGLFIEGAGWNLKQGIIEESIPKVLFVPLPILFVTANNSKDQLKVTKQVFGPQGPYEAPCYKYNCRTDRFLIVLINLKCPTNKGPSHWGLRGVCLLCNTES